MLGSIREDAMALILKIVATLLILVGIIWFLQGINVLPGSVMTGDMKWAVIGAVSVAVALDVPVRVAVADPVADADAEPGPRGPVAAVPDPRPHQPRARGEPEGQAAPRAR